MQRSSETDGPVLIYTRPPVSEAQAVLIDSPKRFLWVPAATKTGKTVADAIWITEGLLSGERCAWVGPWHRRTRTGYDHIKGFLSEWEAAGYAKCRDTDLTIEVYHTTTGRTGKLTCYSGDNPDGIYGDAFDRVVCDEATRMPEAVFPAIRSTVTATGGRVRFTFNTDRGSRNWAIREAKRAERGEEPSYGFLTMRADESPYIDPSDIEQARRTLPSRVFEALYNAVVHEDGAGVFTHPELCVGGTLAPPIFGKTYVVGVDLGRKRDYTVAIVMDRLSRHVVHMERMHGLSWKLQRERIAEIAKRYNRAKVLVDATGLGDPNLEELQRAGLHAEGVIIGTNSAKRDLIETLVVAIEGRRITYPALPVLLGELEVFEYETTRSGAITYSAPDGYHDDCVLSLALAVKGLGALSSLPAEAYKDIACGESDYGTEDFLCL